MNNFLNKIIENNREVWRLFIVFNKQNKRLLIWLIVSMIISLIGVIGLPTLPWETIQQTVLLEWVPAFWILLTAVSGLTFILICLFIFPIKWLNYYYSEKR